MQKTSRDWPRTIYLAARLGQYSQSHPLHPSAVCILVTAYSRAKAPNTVTKVAMSVTLPNSMIGLSVFFILFLLCVLFVVYGLLLNGAKDRIRTCASLRILITNQAQSATVPPWLFRLNMAEAAGFEPAGVITDPGSLARTCFKPGSAKPPKMVGQAGIEPATKTL
jgi:hypothetical protein